VEEDYVSQSEFGRRTGRSQQAVSKLVLAGKLPTEMVDGRTLIPFQRAMAALQTNLDPAQTNNTPQSPGQGGTYHQLRTAQLALKVQEKRIDIGVKEGRLIDKAMVERRVFEFTRGLRDSILNFPTRYASVMAAELGVDPGKLQDVLDRRLKGLLTEIADRQLKI
jgi:hypothetical protein